MAKKKEEQKLNYREELQKLKSDGPQRLYLLWGAEDYLREQYLIQLKKLCLPEGEDSFSYKRLDGPELAREALLQAIDTPPFLSERSFVELRDVDLNHLSEPEKILAVLSEIPDYCTIAFVQSAQFEPDGRLKLIKGLRELARELHFTRQSQGALTDWVSRRFAAAGKSIDLEAAQRLIFVSGDLMSRLIQEIEKVAAYAKGERPYPKHSRSASLCFCCSLLRMHYVSLHLALRALNFVPRGTLVQLRVEERGSCYPS